MAGPLESWERALLHRARLAQIANGAETAALVVEIGNQYLAGNVAKQELQLALVSAERLGFVKSADIAAAHIDRIRKEYGVDGVIESPDFPLDAALARAESTLAALDRVATDGDRRKVFETAAVWADRGAKTGGRQTVSRSAAKSGRRWRRVPDGDPCTFCAMLATRGFLDGGYLSEESALFTAAGDKFHDHCGCTAAEIVGTLTPTAAEQDWIAQYLDASAAAKAEGGAAGPSEVAAKMRAGGNFNDSPKRDDEKVLTDESKWDKLTDEQLEAIAERAMNDGDFEMAERVGEILDARFYDESGRRIDPSDPFQPTVFEWFESQPSASQDRFLDQLSEYDREHFLRASSEHMTGREARDKLTTKRQDRAQYELYLETEFLQAEAATNGFMLTAEARAAGRSPRDLWSVNEATARNWASPEMLDYWDQRGRLTWQDWQDMMAGDTGDIQKRGGTWLQ